jgi:hypothetical protein
MDLQRIRVDLEEFAEALSREEYLTRAGLREESRAASIRERFAVLGSREAFERAREAALAAGAANEGRRLRYLAEFLGNTCIEYRVRAASDRLVTAEAVQVVDVDGERIPLRAVEGRIKNAADRTRRAALEDVRLRAIATLNGLRQEILEHAYEEVRRLARTDYVTFCRDLSGIDLGALRDLTRPILPRTRDMYAETLAWHLARWADTSPRSARRHDLLRVFRAQALDGLFRPDAMREAAEGPCRRMAIDPRAGGRIRVDDDPRPNKASRAFVATPRVPDEIILVVRPSGGPDDYAAYLHELGHALHFAHTDPGLAVEYRRLGDSSVTEAYAFLFDGWLRERTWLKRFAGVGQPRDVLRFTAFHKLWFLRRYAAKLDYELLLHADGPGPRSRDAYHQFLSEAILVDWPADLWLFDVDPFFYAARYLRAWIFEAQLRDLLRDRFDEEWFRNDRTGPFLIALWRQGQRLTLEELAADLGLGAPSIDPLLAQIAADLA